MYGVQERKEIEMIVWQTYLKHGDEQEQVKNGYYLIINDTDTINLTKLGK